MCRRNDEFCRRSEEFCRKYDELTRQICELLVFSALQNSYFDKFFNTLRFDEEFFCKKS